MAKVESKSDIIALRAQDRLWKRVEGHMLTLAGRFDDFLKQSDPPPGGRRQRNGRMIPPRAHLKRP